MSRLEELMALIRELEHAAVQHDRAPAHERKYTLQALIDARAALERALRDALEPQGWQLVPRCLTPDMRELMLRADEFTTNEMWAMLLAAAPKEPT